MKVLHILLKIVKWAVLSAIALVVLVVAGFWLYSQAIGFKRGYELGRDSVTDGNVGATHASAWAATGWRTLRWGMGPGDVVGAGVLKAGASLEPVQVEGINLMTNYRGPLTEPFHGFDEALFSFSRRGLYAVGARRPKRSSCFEDQRELVEVARSYGGSPYTRFGDPQDAECNPNPNVEVEFCKWRVNDSFVVNVARYGVSGTPDCWAEIWLERPPPGKKADATLSAHE